MLIIDAYNVLHAAKARDPRLGGLNIRTLAQLAGVGQFSGRSILIVCDGTGGIAKRDAVVNQELGNIRHGEVSVVYAGPGRDADSLIERLLDELEFRGRARSAIVVSNDRRVQAAATGARARTLSADDFLARLAHDVGRARDRQKAAREDRPEFAQTDRLDQEAVKAWMREFGVTDGFVPPIQAGAEPGHAALPSPGVPPVVTPAARSKTSNPTPPPGPEIDPILRLALQEWGDRLRLDDLDMSQWLNDDTSR